MKLLFASTLSSLAVRIAVALLLLTSCFVKNVSATSHDDDASSQSSSSMRNEDKDLTNYDHGSEDDTSMVNKVMTRPVNRLLFNTTTSNGFSTNNDDEWVQLGVAIKGKAAGDLFGSSIATSKSGDFVIIGGRENDDNGAGAGIAQIYKYIKDTEMWEKVGGDILGEKAGDFSAYAVDINDTGDVVIIGSPGTAHARVFRLVDGQWNKQGQEIIGTTGSKFGFSVSISSDGGKVIIGGPYSSKGYAEVYEYNADIQRWEQVGDSIVATEAASNYFGWSVHMDDSGDVVIVGAPYPGPGLAQVYRNVDGQWIKQGQDLDGKGSGDHFGFDVAISDDGKKAVIGGPYHDANGESSGYAQVYKYKDDTQKWEQVGSDITGEEKTEYLGWAVDINSTGDAVIVGAPDNYYLRNKPGYARIFQLVDDSQWVQQGQDLDGRFSYDSFGSAVAISGNGEGGKVFIGAPDNDGNGSNSGHVRAFIFNKPSTAQPSSMPSIQPSSKPSIQPSLPNVLPSKAPSITTDHPTSIPPCPDSPLKVLTDPWEEGMKSARSCDAVAKKPKKFCWLKRIKTHCPYACGDCGMYGSSDSSGSFIYQTEEKDCDWVRALDMFEASELCQVDSIHKTCRETCSLFIEKCECCDE